MSFQIPDILLALPELVLLALACVILVGDLFVPDDRRVLTYAASLGTLLVTAGLVAVGTPEETVTGFNGMLVLDPLAGTLKMAVLLATAVTLVYARQYLAERELHKGEFYVLAMLSNLGMMAIISGGHFIVLYLGLELMSLSLYAMVALHRESTQASEAAMKYFVLGAIGSGMLLYGMSILYGLSGSLFVDEVATYLAGAQTANAPAILALTFILASLAFKLGAVPFHMWLPDVYNGAPTPMTLFVGSAPKIAAFAMFLRLLVEGLGPMHGDWGDMVSIVAVLSLAVGSLLAIAQSNIKRMLAYSTITHIGFLLVGLAAGSAQGYGAATFYILVYVLMALGAFGMVILLSRRGFEADQLEDFAGLNERSPWFAAMMLLIMFSMAGVPPTVGFFAKLAVFDAAIGADRLYLAIFGVIFAVVSAFYYLRVVKLMYFDSTEESGAPSAPLEMRALLSVNGLAVLGLGALPGVLLGLCQALFA